MDSVPPQEQVSTFSQIVSWFESLSGFELAMFVVATILVLVLMIRLFGAFIFEFLGEILSALD